MVTDAPERLRVLFDAHHLGQRHTGNETWARNVISHLGSVAPDLDITYAVTAAGKDDIAAIDARNRSVLVSDSSVRRLSLDLPRIVRRAKPQAVFTQYTMSPIRVPALVLCHDVSAEDPQSVDWLSKGTRLRYRASFRSSARFARKLLTVSEFTKAELVRLYSRDPADVLVAPNAVDPELLRLIESAKPSRCPGFTVLAAGNVLPRKNLAVAGAALRALVAEGLDVRMRVVGQVPRVGRPQADLLRELLGDRLSFTGYVTQEQLAREYVAADALVFPSFYEGFGIPVLEAMAAGTAVVVSDRTALPEVAGDAALVVDANDVAGWAAALRRLLLDGPLRAEMVARGRARVEQFSWRESAEIVAEALRSCAPVPG